MTAPEHEVRPVDRRVRRTQKAIRDAFISLVLERGYDNVLIEDIAERADIGRATFYAHYSDKDDLFATLFSQLSDELDAKVAEVDRSSDDIRADLIRMLFEEAQASRDLYRICLSGAGNGRARARYLKTIADTMAYVYMERIKKSPYPQRIPVKVYSQYFAGAHVALLEMWLADDDRMPIDEIVTYFTQILVYGYGWAAGVVPDDFVDQLPKIKLPS